MNEDEEEEEDAFYWEKMNEAHSCGRKLYLAKVQGQPGRFNAIVSAFSKRYGDDFATIALFEAEERWSRANPHVHGYDNFMGK